MRKQIICIGENKDVDQLRGNREADQRLCFRYIDSTIPLLLKSEISRFLPSSVTVQPSMCRAWSEPKSLVFSRTCSYAMEPRDASSRKVKVGNDQVMAQSERNSHSENRGWKKKRS